MSAGLLAPLLVAALFAVFAGFNDAGVLVGIGAGTGGLRPAGALALLTGAVLATPAVGGTAVAATLGARLVPAAAGQPGAHTQVLAGIGAAVAITVLLGARALPTSLTLALIGGIAGAGTGTGLAQPGGPAVDWALVCRVLMFGAAAPVVGAVVALAASRALAGLDRASAGLDRASAGADRAPARAGSGAGPGGGPRVVAGGAGVRPAAGVSGRLRWLHRAGFAAACVAYGANDGQKMLAVYAVLFGGAPARYLASPGALLVIAVGFLAGGTAGLRRLATANGLSATRTDAVVVTQLSGASVVLCTAALGAPVSMTQSLSGALVGTGLSRGTRRVRWRGVLRLGRAWLVTLPAAFLLGLLAGAVAGWAA